MKRYPCLGQDLVSPAKRLASETGRSWNSSSDRARSRGHLCWRARSRWTWHGGPAPGRVVPRRSAPNLPGTDTPRRLPGPTAAARWDRTDQRPRDRPCGQREPKKVPVNAPRWICQHHLCRRARRPRGGLGKTKKAPTSRAGEGKTVTGWVVGKTETCSCWIW